MPKIYERNLSRVKSLAFDRVLKDLNVANSLLLGEIKSKQMDSYIRAICAVYLFQSNTCEKNQFLFELFEDLSRKKKWKDAAMLTLKLQAVFESCSAEFPHEFCSNIVVTFNVNERNLSQNVIGQLSELLVNVNVQWPISVVFSPEIFRMLNQVFVFLSQIKWAKFSITRLKLWEVALRMEREEKSIPKMKHLLFQFRFRMIHFVNVLETYFMTRVVHTAHNGLRDNVQKVRITFECQALHILNFFSTILFKAQTLSELMNSVEDFATTLWNRCLLNKESSRVRIALLAALNTFLVFVNLCEKLLASPEDNSVAVGVAKGIQQAYKTFTNIYVFIQSVLGKLVKRGSFQHLESLALALI